MSGPIRAAIELPKQRLREYIAKANELLLVELPYENVADFKLLLEKMDEMNLRLSNTISTMEKLNQDWIKYIQQLPQAKQEREEECYQEMASNPEGVLHIMESARELKDSLDCRRMKILSTLGSSSRSLSSSKIGDAVPANVRLPHLELKSYYGDPIQWPTFWSIFESAVHQQAIPKIQKLNCLLSCLKGKAAAAVQGYCVSPENYEVVLQLLKQQFGDVSVIRRNLYADLAKLNGGNNLKEFVDDLERILRQLETLGENLELPYFHFLVEQKCPFWALTEILEMKSKDSNWSLQKVRNYLQQKVRIQEQVMRIRMTNKSEPQRSKPKNPYSNEETLAFATVRVPKKSQNESNKKSYKKATKPKIPCIFCRKDHWNDECQEFATPERRREKAQSLGLCLKCLKEGHQIVQCTFKKRCYHCRGAHNSVFCFKRQKDEKVISNVDDGPRLPRMANLSIKTKENDTKMVLLMCCKVNVVPLGSCTNNRKQNSFSAVVFFDPGSQTSFVTKRFVKRLGLRGSFDPISVATFGNEVSNNLNAERVSFGIKLLSKQIQTVEAYAVDFITKPLQLVRFPVLEDCREAVHMLWQEPDILIGMDQYFSFVKAAPIRQLSNGFHVVPAKRLSIPPTLDGPGQQ